MRRLTAWDSVTAALGRVLRWVLPLAALVLLSTIFLISGQVDPDQAVQESGLDIEELTREPRIGMVRIAGVTRDDAALNVTAAALRTPGDPRGDAPLRLFLDAPRGLLSFPNGRQVEFESESGQLDQTTERLVMRGDVRLVSSDGYDARMRELTTALDRSHILGTGGVTATGPPGEITARTVTIRPSENDSDGYLLAFRGDVRVIYHPDPE
ncbi:MAG: hypothetical protein JJU09_10380 [Rhodobacteraceae bacterium]|nr:hypothetical protein [Paracoccaceae bacterium]